MARNSEKKLIGLNRMLLEQQQKEELEKRPKRPSLLWIDNSCEKGKKLNHRELGKERTLHSASEVKRWIPSIKREIDYYLQQISGARQHTYPDQKMKEFEEKVDALEKEYKRFVATVYQLDPSTTGIPWQARGYVSKRKTTPNTAGDHVPPKRICTPLLEQEGSQVKREFSSFSNTGVEKKSEVTNSGTLASTSVNKDKEKPIKKPGFLGLDYSDSSEEEEDNT